jgi:CHAT domain-containing protein
MRSLFGLTYILVALAIIAAHSQGKNDLWKAESLFTAGKQLYQNGKFKASADTLNLAATLFERQKNISGQIKSMFLFGDSKATLGDCEKAQEVIRRATQLAKENFKPVSPELADSYYYMARTCACTRVHDEGIGYLNKSIALKRNLYGEGTEVAFDYDFIGYFYTNIGKHDSAFYYLDKALQIRQKKLPPDDIELANTLYNIGRNHENQFELDKALYYHDRALTIRQVKLDPEHESLANSLHQIGSAYQKLGNYDRAIDYCNQALAISIKAFGPIHTNVAANYMTIGNLHGFMFNYREAVHFIKEGNSILEKIYGDKSDILPTYQAYLGRLYGFLGEHQSALSAFKTAQRQAEKNLAPNHAYLGIVYNIIGDYYSTNNNPALALKYFEKALTIFRVSSGRNSVREADILGRIGLLQIKAKDTEKGFESYDLALKIYLTKMGMHNSKVAALLQHIGDGHVEQTQFQSALQYYQKAFLSVSTGFSDTLNLLATPALSQLDNEPMALQIARKKATVLEKLSRQTPDKVAGLKNAFTTYQFAIDLIEKISSGYSLASSRVELEKDSRSVYNNTMKVAYELYLITRENYFINEAFLVSEKSKASMLLENVRDSHAKTVAGVPDSLVERERDFKIELAYGQAALHTAICKRDTAMIATKEKEIFNIQERYDKLKRRLQEDYPSYFNLKYDKSISSLTQIQKGLPNKTTLLIEYFVADSVIYKFTVSSSSIAFEKIENRARLAQLMRDYEKCLTDGDFILNSRLEADSLYSSTAYALYDILLSSSVKANPLATKFIIVPDGSLGQFSFGSLITSEAPAKNPDYKNLRYLSTQFEISYAYSASLTNSMSVTRRKPSKLFAGFAPSYTGGQFANLDTLKHPMTYLVMRSGNLPLPGAADEVKLISQLMEGHSWLNQQATETNFKLNAGNYRILHLAMHSLLNNEHPQYSELLFNAALDPDNDGYMTVDEIYNLNLNASLVVLSACSSGYGKVQQGEGPISISRAFSYAGCPSVLMSLWKIPDDVTRHIMTSFYLELKNGKPKDEALRLAQVNFLNETKDPLYHHPYFWGSFVVMGDTVALPEKFPWWMVLSGFGGALVLFVFLNMRKRKA